MTRSLSHDRPLYSRNYNGPYKHLRPCARRGHPLPRRTALDRQGVSAVVANGRSPGRHVYAAASPLLRAVRERRLSRHLTPSSLALFIPERCVAGAAVPEQLFPLLPLIPTAPDS